MGTIWYVLSLIVRAEEFPVFHYRTPPRSPNSSPTPIRRIGLCTTATYLGNLPTIIRNTASAGLIDPSPR